MVGRYDGERSQLCSSWKLKFLEIFCKKSLVANLVSGSINEILMIIAIRQEVAIWSFDSLENCWLGRPRPEHYHQRERKTS